MHRLKRVAPRLLALACLAFVLVSLLPDSPLYARDEARLHSVRVQGQLEQVLFEAPSPVDLGYAVVFPRPWQYSPLQLGRALIAAHCAQFDASPTTCFLNSAPSYPPRFTWCKHRRYTCQMLDTPPPPDLLPRTL